MDLVTHNGGVRVAEVVEALGISEMTVRRDITELVSTGLVERVHGGAVAAEPSSMEPRFATKSEQYTNEKRQIALAAAKLVRPQDSLALSGGTTTLAVARALTELEHFPTLTIITNSLPAANLLFDAADAARKQARPAPSVILIGGEHTPSAALVGLIGIDALSSLRVDWSFMGACSIDQNLGLMAPNLSEAATNRALVHCSRTTVAVMDASKWDTLGLQSFCSMADLDVLITDRSPKQEVADYLEDHGITLTVAK